MPRAAGRAPGKVPGRAENSGEYRGEQPGECRGEQPGEYQGEQSNRENTGESSREHTGESNRENIRESNGMKIHGLQKMTLLDFPGHVACTVFLGGCDFRCPFCHNYGLACGKEPAVMDSEELLAFLEKRKGLLDGVAVTGGEPCLYQELPDLLGRFRDMGYATKLDTNGYHPQLLRQILSDRLADYVAMDIKNSPGKYALTAGVENVDMALIRESIGILIEGQTDRL